MPDKDNLDPETCDAVEEELTPKQLKELTDPVDLKQKEPEVGLGDTDED